VFAFYAAKMGVDYESFEATARADFDVRGHMIVDAPPSSFKSVTIDMRIVSGAPAEKLREIERLALAGCPGIATLRNPVAVASNLSLARPGGDAVAAE
jgi:uncharacterized OsmC-like protein